MVVSPFSRTQQTAQNVSRVLGWSDSDARIQVEPELRERYFGPEMELQSHTMVSVCSLSTHVVFSVLLNVCTTQTMQHMSHTV
eukprot:jgi/Chlat1/2478/Chrsp175S02359